MVKKLDNPVWYSLSETHKDFSIDYKNLKFYAPDYCPFGGFENDNDISSGIDEYAKLTNNFFIVGEKPKFSKKINLKNELVCLQMVAERKIDVALKENVVKLNDKFEESLYNLVDLVQPGYFKKKTTLMGDYFGVFKDNTLVAVTGERMKMNEFTEVSAVVTHPLYTGRGYAKQLVAYTVNKIFDQNKTPYLHVAEKNNGAIRLYEKLGFKTRRKISFWNFVTD
ncbi:MAG TPA: GNAT family N-acetyltransferase [Chitinophagaceae bacterium]|jgi:predicted GNAT family acetyltransferase|nr:GNAT family N-acetyltransferase [Chitinophagaceae bacterium]